MGMTDKQFDAYNVQLLRRLERAAEEYDDGKSELLRIIADLRAELGKD